MVRRPYVDNTPAFVCVDSAHSLSWTCTAYQQYHAAFDVLVRETQNGVIVDMPHSASQRRINGFADVIQLDVGRLGA